MTNILDSRPDAQAYAFTYRFQVGHELRTARVSQLRIEAERHVEEVRLFLDAAGLVEGIEDAAASVDANLSVDGELASGDLQVVPRVSYSAQAPRRTASSAVALTMSIPAGTEIGISADSPDAGVRIRFPHETTIEVGRRGGRALGKYELRGLHPVLLNGIPFLEVDVTQPASVRLHATEAKTAILGLLAIVSPYRRRGGHAVYHVMEAIGDRVVGGASLRMRV